MLDHRASEAARSVQTIFARKLFGIPGTNLCALHRPQAPKVRWTYWWQAHFLDCLVDAYQRGCPNTAPALFTQQLRGIWLMQGLRFTNRYFDDMAWLALAAQRGGRHLSSLEAKLRSGVTSQWGGGSFWSTQREYKATAATGPSALFLARCGDTELARQMTNWLTTHLADPETGLLWDGMRVKDDVLTVEHNIFTYNQGPILGVWLELGDAESLAAVASHVAAINNHLTLPGTAILRTHGSGDAGLFTGVLARYLALVARDPRIPQPTKQLAAAMVHATADNLWAGRVERGWRYVPVSCFPQDTALERSEVAQRVELSTQLQAWMTFEAASSLDPEALSLCGS